MSDTHTPADFITSLSAAAFCAVLAELPDPDRARCILAARAAVSRLVDTAGPLPEDTDEAGAAWVAAGRYREAQRW